MGHFNLKTIERSQVADRGNAPAAVVAVGQPEGVFVFKAGVT